jgi:hypothetical protein
MSKILTHSFRYNAFVLLIGGLLLSFSTAAQRVELGVSLCAANYVGDLAPTMVLSETKPGIGFFGRYTLSSSFALTGSMMFSRVAGSDENFDFNKPRNLSFRSKINEYSAVLEFNFFKYGKGVLDKKFTSYVFLGIGVLNFNPQAYYNNDWRDLRPLQTEGKDYKTSTAVIPFGLGIKWKLSKHFALESSFGFRKTYTDRLDDVSETYADVATQQTTKGVIGAYLTDPSAGINNGVPQFSANHRRGNADFNDWYVIANISLSYRIFGRSKCARFY